MFLQRRGADVTRKHWVEEVAEDPRIEFLHRDISDTKLPSDSVAVAVLDLVVHELPPHATRAVIQEAFRILVPGGELWVNEMDFNTRGFSDLRANPLLFSLIRATEPFLDEYAEYESGGEMFSDLLSAGFASVRVGAATGRHFALVAVKPPDPATNEEEHGVVLTAVGLDDRRFDENGNHLKEDTHLKTWEVKKQ
uniref:Methyltransferase domain-containing protein n=1 Tax=Octactis speculum TaxID=3111310 RepID=A0A7S2FBD2_9STRA|mmetsp:Transcript_19191/g.26036  ORF Transcript_19191/g.26036 Transcript_19191/m.26036 type:complete len:195 (+) Transcript_19191:282-866(+)